MSAASPWLALFRKQRASESAKTQKRLRTKSKSISATAQNRQPANQIDEKLHQTEKDAARYRWLMQNAKLGIGRNGKDWDLQIDGPAPDSISEVGEWIDNRIDRIV